MGVNDNNNNNNKNMVYYTSKQFILQRLQIKILIDGVGSRPPLSSQTREPDAKRSSKNLTRTRHIKISIKCCDITSNQ